MVQPEWIGAGANLMVGLGFIFGSFVMNFPQHYECWKHRSAEGLSLAYILLCTISNVLLWLATLLGDYNEIIAIATGANATVIGNETSAPSLDVEWDGPVDTSSRMLLAPLWDQEQDINMTLLQIINTLNAMMPTFQNFIMVLIGVPSLIFYYFLFSKPQQRIAELVEDLVEDHAPASEEPLLVPDDSEQGDVELTTTAAPPRTRTRSRRLYYSDGTEHRWAMIFTVLTWLICLVCTIVTAVVLTNNLYQWESSLLAVFGSIAAVTNMLLYFPQIVTTHRNQHEGVLSLSSLLMSVGGDMSMLFFWIVGPGESIWVLGSLVADAGMQLILIWMIINFRKKRFQQEQLISQQQQQIYEYVHDSAEMEDDSDCDMVKGEIQVVFGDLLDIYEDTASAIERMMETPSRQSMTSTSLGSLEDSRSEMII